MPKPNKNEPKDEFLKRCMSDAEANNSFPNQSQRYAFCNSQWDNRNKDSQCDNKKEVMKDTYSYKDCAIAPAVKDVDGMKGIVTGYFAHFGNVDMEGDIITQGAFAKTIKQNGPASNKPRIKHLFNHDPSQPLGVLNNLQEDTIGLYYESKVGGHALGQDFIKMVMSGLITEHSIGFQTKQSRQIQDYADYQKNPSHGFRELTELQLWEGSSLSAWGANDMTPLTGLKALKDKSESIVKFCKDTNATDQTIELLLLYNNQLVQLINDWQTKQPAPDRLEIEEPQTAIVTDEIEETKSPVIPEVVTCPHCKTYNYNSESGYIRCRSCAKTFVPGGIAINI